MSLSPFCLSTFLSNSLYVSVKCPNVFLFCLSILSICLLSDFLYVLLECTNVYLSFVCLSFCLTPAAASDTPRYPLLHYVFSSFSSRREEEHCPTQNKISNSVRSFAKTYTHVHHFKIAGHSNFGLKRHNLSFARLFALV